VNLAWRILVDSLNQALKAFPHISASREHRDGGYLRKDVDPFSPPNTELPTGTTQNALGMERSVRLDSL
jgi:hypothetical protein